jgi:hypothetical protein
LISNFGSSGSKTPVASSGRGFLLLPHLLRRSAKFQSAPELLHRNALSTLRKHKLTWALAMRHSHKRVFRKSMPSGPDPSLDAGFVNGTNATYRRPVETGLDKKPRSKPDD